MAEETPAPQPFGAAVLDATIRSTPEDFVVEEILGFEPSGQGEHLFLEIEKRGANTVWVATLLAIIAVGVMAHRVLGQRLLGWFEAFVQRIPLANLIYGGVRKLIDILQTQPEGAQRVVLIDFPHRDMKAVGFVTRILTEEGSGRELAAVYVPTTPNPTSGYLEVVPVENLTPTDWSVDQAMSFIISGGAVSPTSVPFTRSADQARQGAPDAE